MKDNHLVYNEEDKPVKGKLAELYEHHFNEMRNSEADKIGCGRNHIEALNIDLDVITNSGDLM